MKKLTALLIIIMFTIGCNAQKFESIPAKQFSEKIKTTPKPQILDVRTKVEFETGHIENAINIDWNAANFDNKINIFDKTKPIFVNCQLGGRSKKAANKLVLLGFNTIYELDGGIASWIASDFLIKI